MSEIEELGKNILILEGGGAGGLSSLFILREIMNRVKAAGGDPSIFRQFVLVAGTGTGGVQACMLGRLRIDLAQVIQMFAKLLKDVFSEKKISMSDSAVFKATQLEIELKQIVKDATGDENTRLMVPVSDEEGCKTMVFAMSKHNMNAALPRIFRSYQGYTNQIPDCTIWEALRATMAHPEMFRSIEIGEPGMREEFVGGDMGCSNPVAHVLAEAAILYPNNHIASILCIGAGHTRTIHIPKPNPLQRMLPTNMLIAMKDIATDSERAAQDMAVRFQGTSSVYFRFSVDQGMQNVRMDEWQRQSEVVAHTRSYMQRLDVDEKINSAAQAIKARKAAIGAGYINGRIHQPSVQASTGVKHCPAPSPLFTGCESQVAQISSCLLAPSDERRICVVHGLGGAGKTQIALQAIERTKAHWEDIVYVDATSRKTAIATLKGFALAREIGETHEDAIRWLESDRQRWLMVFDNADDPDLDLTSFIPTGSRGSILITTRLRNLALLGQGPHSDCSVGNMEAEDAVELLLKKARLDERTLAEDEREAAAELVKQLGYLALAVVHAGAYIWCSKVSIVKYRQECLKHCHSALERYGKMNVNVEQYKKTVYTAWLMNYERLGRATQRLLSMIGFLHHDGITEDIFRRAATNKSYCPEISPSDKESAIQQEVEGYLKCFLDTEEKWDSNAFSAMMNELLSYSLIDYDRVNDAYSIHVLVQEWARLVESDRGANVLDHASFLVSLSIDGCSEAEDGIATKRLVSHVNNLLSQQVKVDANSAARFALVYSGDGQWKDEEMLLMQVLDARKKALGEEHLTTLTAMADLSLNFSSQGRWKESEVLDTQVLDAMNRALGKDHPNTLSIMGNLALTYRNQGRWGEAETLQVQVLNASKQVLDEDHPNTLTAMSNLALTYYDQGRWKEAEALQVRVMDAKKQTLGEDHPYALIATNNLALTYQGQGRWEEAEAIQTQVLNATKRVMGETHPDALRAMGNLAATYHNQGRLDEAEALEVQVLDATKQLLGQEHPNTLTAMSNLASTYQDQGRWEEAEALQTQALNSIKRLLGENHPGTLRDMGNLATTYQNQGRWDEAEALQLQAMDATKRLFGQEHPDTLRVLGNLAGTYSNQGRWGEAEALEVQVLDARKRVLGEDHPETLVSMGNLALTYQKQGRWEEAEVLQVQALNKNKRVLGEDHPNTLIAMENLARTYRSQGRWEKAEVLELQAINTSKRVLGKEHPDTLNAIGGLAATYQNQGRWKEAEGLQLQVLNATKRVHSEDHPNTLYAMGGLARTYSQQGRWNEAEALQMQVLNAIKRLYGQEHPDVLRAMGSLAVTHQGQGRWEEAEVLQMQVLTTSKQSIGAEHPDTLVAMSYLAGTYLGQGLFKEAETLVVQLLDTSKRVRGEDHPGTINVIAQLAAIYKGQDRWGEAEALQMQVMKARVRLLGEDHPHTLGTMDKLAMIYSGQGRWEEAEALQVQVLDARKRLFGEEHEETLKSMRPLLATYKSIGWKRYPQCYGLGKQIEQLEAKLK